MKKLLYLIPFLFIQLVSALNVSDIRTIIRRNMRDSDLSNPRYTNAVILDLMNEAQSEINNQSLLSHSPTTYILTAGTSYYNVPTDFMSPDEVYFKKNTGETIRIFGIEQNKLYVSKPDWDRTKGEPTMYWVSDASYSVITATAPKRISFIPVPTNLSTGTVTMWYFTTCQTLVNDSDIPFNGQYELLPYHYTIVNYVTMRLKIIDGIIDEANAYSSLYQNGVNKLTNFVGNVKPPLIPQTQSQPPPQQQ
jgi:hypothetical protein